jgi:hypothetical protein
MNASAVSRVLSLIPERVARPLSGSLFTDEEAGRALHADRVAYVAKFLSWLTPLNPITKDDQRFLGLLATHARSELAADDEAGDDLDSPLDEEGADEMVFEETAGINLATPPTPLSTGGST